MADQTTTNWSDFLYELRGPMQELFPTEFVLMAEIDRTTRDSGPNRNRDIFSGNQVRVPLLPVPHQGGGFVSETGTWNVPIAQATDQAHINMCRYIMPVSVTPDLLQASLNNSAATAMATLVKTSRIGMARDENTALNGDGTGLIATVSGGSSGSLTIIFGSSTAPANADELFEGRVVDILTIATVADPGSGLRRKINTTTDNGDGTVTCVFSTTQQASDGGSGNITFSSAEGAFLAGSGTTAANAGTKTPQGIQQVIATTGTFEGIDKAAHGYWRGTDGRGGTTTSQALSTSMLDGGVRRLWSSGVKQPSFIIGDPAVIDLYQQSLYNQSRWAGQSGTLQTGFEGIAYKGTVLVAEHQHKRGSLTGIDKGSLQMYGYNQGPDFLNDDGGQFRRFTRTLPKEFDLVDFWQLGAMRAATHVFWNNLQRAA